MGRQPEMAETHARDESATTELFGEFVDVDAGFAYRQDASLWCGTLIVRGNEAELPKAVPKPSCQLDDPLLNRFEAKLFEKTEAFVEVDPIVVVGGGVAIPIDARSHLGLVGQVRQRVGNRVSRLEWHAQAPEGRGVNHDRAQPEWPE